MHILWMPCRANTVTVLLAWVRPSVTSENAHILFVQEIKDIIISDNTYVIFKTFFKYDICIFYSQIDFI